jgi:hypothetical protein
MFYMVKQKKIVHKFKKIKDSAARIRHMYWLETEMTKGTKITEKSAAGELEKIQSFVNSSNY